MLYVIGLFLSLRRDLASDSSLKAPTSGGESRNTTGLPNFFAEAIVSTGNPIVRKRLTLYDGTIGAHGMHALHSLTGRGSPRMATLYMISAPDNGDDVGS